MNHNERQHEEATKEAYEDQIEGNWKQFRGRVKEAWGALTDDDLDRAEGRKEQLIGVIQEKSGETRARIAEKLRELADRVD